MDIYQASDGGVYQLDRHLREYESLPTLYDEISSITAISPENILLFMRDGKEVKQDTIEEHWRQPGPSDSQNVPRIELYLFNRESYWSDPEQWALQFQEDVQLPPPMDASLTFNLDHVQHPFLIAHDHLLHLQSLYQAQSHALSIAYDNLSHHLQPFIREFQVFAGQAEKELREEEGLIKGAPVDMALLPKLPINPALMRRKSSEGEEVKAKTLADYVNPRKMESVRESCRVSYEEHVERFNDLASQMDELALQSAAERRAFEEKAEAVGGDFSEGIARLEIALSHLQQLVGSGADDVSQDCIELDQAMRDDLVALTGVKNDFTLEIHIHLRQVASFQSRLTSLVTPLTQLDADLRAKGAFPHLHRLRMLPFAYATAVAEIARRKEYGRALLEWSELFVDALTRFTSTEKARREQVQVDVLSQLPWTLPPFENATNPHVNLSVMTGSENFDGVPLGYDEVEKLVRWVESVKHDQDVLIAMEDAEDSHLDSLQQRIESLLGQVSFANDELDKMVERSVLLTRRQAQSAAHSQSLALSSQLRAANQERNGQAQRLAELETAHAAHIQDLEEQHEQRMASFQTRQAEMQDEMVRLRTDLGDEMVARQALSAELEERAREQDERTREHDDQSDLITALQAELAQEKDRATDLGVRLQEALLDVDGLKSAEQTLIAQLQELQEERTRSLQSLGEAQLVEQNYESQLAGLRAELEATTEQLVQAQNDRDTALRSQSAEAERLMRDHIAEADGDRAVLEHQNLTLNKQLEDAKSEMEEKLSAARNAAIRQADGLKAELSLTRAQLREVLRKEAVLAGELAMAQDSATAMSQERSYQSDVSRDAVSLAAKYHDTCQRLLNAINASTTISGTNGSQIRSRSPAPTATLNNGIGGVTQSISALSVTSRDKDDHMRESVLVRSLATASNFDLIAFAEAVQRTINLVKKWSKNCKQYRDAARNKISFINFVKGDLALFLPTRNAAARSWAAFNLSAPHNFLKVTDAMQEQIKTREWIVARIVDTEEAVASGGDSTASNPYGLADGLRYWTHHVEEYNPSSTSIAPRPVRRSTSAGITSTPDRAERERQQRERGRDMSASQLPLQNSVYQSPSTLAMEQMSTADLMLDSRGPATATSGALSALGTLKGRDRSQSGYFPPMSAVVEIERDGPAVTEMSSRLDQEQNEVDKRPEIAGENTPEKNQRSPVKGGAPLALPAPTPAPLPTPTPEDDPNIPPSDIAHTPVHPTPIDTTVIPPAPSSSTTSAKDIPRRITSSSSSTAHQRIPSRNSNLTPSSPAKLGSSIDRERERDLLNRPSSVASSGGSYPKALSLGLGMAGGKSTPAPAMATTSSGHSGGSTGDDLAIRQTQLRKKSSNYSLSNSKPGSVSPDGRPAPQSVLRRGSTGPVVTGTGVTVGTSPLSQTLLPEAEPGSVGDLTSTSSAAGTGTQAQGQYVFRGVGDFASLGTGPGPGPGLSSSAAPAIPRSSSASASGPLGSGETSTASKLIRGFTIGRMRGSTAPLPADMSGTNSNQGGGGMDGGKNGSATVKRNSKDEGKAKPSAMDMLRRFEGSN